MSHKTIQGPFETTIDTAPGVRHQATVALIQTPEGVRWEVVAVIDWRVTDELKPDVAVFRGIDIDACIKDAQEALRLLDQNHVGALLNGVLVETLKPILVP